MSRRISTGEWIGFALLLGAPLAVIWVGLLALLVTTLGFVVLMVSQDLRHKREWRQLTGRDQ